MAEPRADLTQLIADNLHSLPHPDGRPRRFLHFSQFGKDEKTRVGVALLAKEHGESIQELLHRNGWSVKHRDDIDPANTADNYKTVNIKCATCGKQLLQLGCNNQLEARLPKLAIKSLTQMEHNCP